MFIYLTSSAGYIMLHHFIIFTKRIGCFILFFFEELKDVKCFPRTARAKKNRADHTPRCLGPGLVGRFDLHRAALGGSGAQHLLATRMAMSRHRFFNARPRSR